MKTIKILFLLLVTSFPLFAQGGSIYSGYGIGDLQTSYSARRFGFGELGIAISDQDFINSFNPAAWNELRMTRYELSLNYSGSLLQGSSESVYHNNVHFNGLAFGFPIDRDLGISFAAGLVPYSNVRYDVIQSQNHPITGNYQMETKGQGGLSKFFIGTTYRLPLDFALGINYDYYFGRVESGTLVTFPDSSGYANSAYGSDVQYHGMSVTAGLISGDLSPIFGKSKIKDFKFGLAYTPTITMSVDSVDNSTTTIGTVETSTGSVTSTIPYKIGVGTTFTYDEYYTFMIDYLYQPFSQYTYNGLSVSSMQDYYKFSLGFEFRNTDYKSNSFWDHIMLRTGVSYEQTQYKINGTGINQVSIYGGFSMPLAFDNSIDVGFQIGKRGTKDNGLILENIYKFNVTLSIGELWFIRSDK
jgi:hypothetical protein